MAQTISKIDELTNTNQEIEELEEMVRDIRTLINDYTPAPLFGDDQAPILNQINENVEKVEKFNRDHSGLLPL